MKKYRCWWCMSTKNHNLLCFVGFSGINLLNKGICLWKAPKTLAERGFPPVQICLKSGAVAEPATVSPQNPSLVLASGEGQGAETVQFEGETVQMWTNRTVNGRWTM
jgi:hypothetical protein